MAYRETPKEVRDELVARRDALSARSDALTTAERGRLDAELVAELIQLEVQLDTVDGDPVGHAERVLRDYDHALEAAVAATDQARGKRRRVRGTLIAAATILTLAEVGRIAYALRNYDAVAESCATHFHCRHTGRCHVEIFHNGSLGVDLRCAAQTSGDCESPCETYGHCELVDHGCAATRPEHCAQAEVCRTHRACNLDPSYATCRPW